MTEVKSRSRVSSWAYAIRTTNPPPDAPIDMVTRWLVVTRAAVLPMTLVSGLVAALLAIGEPGLDWRWLVLSLIGITLAHVANNLMNDLFDTQVGTDSAGYPRALYAPHPVLSGLVSRRTLLVADPSCQRRRPCDPRGAHAGARMAGARLRACGLRARASPIPRRRCG